MAEERPKKDQLVPVGAGAAGAIGPARDADRERRTAEAMRDGVPENTRRAYQADLRIFADWCAGVGATALPATPETVKQFIVDRSTRPWPKGKGRVDAPDKPSTIARRIASIAMHHKHNGLESPTIGRGVQLALRGLRRRGAGRARQATPLTAADLLKWTELRRDDLDRRRPATLRDRAILLLGFAACMRREEIVQIDFEHVSFGDAFSVEPVEVFIPRSKTDKDAVGATVVISPGSNPATCPVRALRALHSEVRFAGPVFLDAKLRRLSTGRVSKIVKAAAALCGHDPKRYSGHSLRRGAATALARAGASLAEIMRHGRWKTAAAALKYIEPIEAARFDASRKLGL